MKIVCEIASQGDAPQSSGRTPSSQHLQLRQVQV